MHLTSQCSSFDYFNGNMLEMGEPSTEEEVMKERHFLLEIKGLFPKRLFLLTSPPPPAPGALFGALPRKCIIPGTALLSFLCLRFPGAGEGWKMGLVYNVLK